MAAVPGNPVASSGTTLSAWRLRSFGGHEMSDEQLAVVPGPLIALVVGFVGVVLGLAVVWRGDVSEIAAVSGHRLEFRWSRTDPPSGQTMGMGGLGNGRCELSW